MGIIEVELGKLYAIWLREFKVFLREKSRLIASLFTPLLWLFVIGTGFGSIVNSPGNCVWIRGWTRNRLSEIHISDQIYRLI